MRLLIETFRPFVLIGLFLVQAFCIFAGCFMALLASMIPSGLRFAESFVFFVPAVLLTLARRVVVRL